MYRTPEKGHALKITVGYYRCMFYLFLISSDSSIATLPIQFKENCSIPGTQLWAEYGTVP